MAFRQPKEKRIQARSLTDPQPRFVSLVTAGANQTPIRSVKVDIVSVEEKEMTKKVMALKAEGHEIKSMVFTKSEGGKFETADDVQKFLDEGGIEGTIKEIKGDDGAGEFVVDNEQDEFTDDVRKIEVSEELTVFVGKLVTPEGEEVDLEAAAKARANKSGSAITKVEIVEVTETKTENEDEGDEEEGDQGSAGATKEDQLTHGIDGSLKPVRTRTRAKAEPKAEANTEAAQKDGDCNCGEGESATKAGHANQMGEADCGPDEVFQDGKCVKTTAKVGDETFQVMFEPLALSAEVAGIAVTIPVGSFEVTEKVELLSGDCGPGHTLFSAGGRSFCVPTGDRSPVADNQEINAPNAAGGQGSAGFGGTTPAAGQVQRTETKNTLRGDLEISTATIAEKFDEFSAFFSDGMTLSEVMDDANDGFPPGLDMVIMAAVMAMRNNFLVGDMDAVRQAGTDLGEVAAILGGLFETAEKSDERKKQIDALSGRFKELAFAEAEEGTEGAEKNDTTEDQGPLAMALAGMASTMKSIADSLGEVKDVVTKNTGATEDLTDRVMTLETRRQTRKGADDGDAVNGSTVQKKSPLADIRLRGALGITNTANRP